METRFKKSIKGKIMESLFDNCDSFMVKFYNNLTLKEGDEFNEEKTYKYDILIRHSENTDAKKLLNEAIKNFDKIPATTTLPLEKGWERKDVTEELCNELGIYDVDGGNDKVKHILVYDGGYWILEHESGTFSTVVMRDSVYGTFEECKELLKDVVSFDEEEEHNEIDFDGKKYPVRTILSNGKSYDVSTEELEISIMPDGEYVSEEAKNVDDKLAYFIPAATIALSNSEIIKYIHEHIDEEII